MKTLKMENCNNKFGSQIFTYIDEAPDGPIPESKLPIPKMIQDPTGSVPPFEAHLITFARTFLYALSSTDTLPASGLDRQQFIEYFLKQRPGWDRNKEVAVYVYKKC